MNEFEPQSEALKKFDIAVFAHKRAAEQVEAVLSPSPQEAQFIAATYVFYRLQADLEARIYHAVLSEHDTEIAPYETDLELADVEAMKLALDEAKNGRYEQVRQYLQGQQDCLHPEQKDNQFSKSLERMLPLVSGPGAPFHEPKLPHQDPEIRNAYQEHQMSHLPEELPA